MALGGAVDLPTIRQRVTVDESALGGLSGRLGKVGGMLGTAVAGGAAVAAAGIGAFVATGVKGAMDVEKGIGEVVTLFGETGEAAQELSAELTAGVAELSNEVGVTQEAITGGLYSAISAGIPKENAFEFMRVASKASIAGVTDVETAIDGMSTTINAFGLEASDAEAVSDSMFAAVQGGKTTFEELSASMSNVAPAAAAAGVGFEEVNAGIATLTAAGVPTAQATTQLRAALVGLQKPSKEMDAIFQDLGHANAQAAIEAEGMGYALTAVSDAADGDNGKLTTLLGSVEAVGAAQIIAGTGAEKFAQEMERQEGAAGASSDAFETMNQTTSRAMENLKVQFQNAAIAVGAEVLPVLNKVVTWASARLPGAIAAVRRGISSMVDVFRTIGAVVGPIIAGVQAALSGSGGGGGLSGSVGRVGEVVQGLRDVFQSAFDAIRAVVTWFVGVVQNLWERFGSHLLDHIETAFNNIMQVVDGVLSVIKGIFDVFAGVFTGDWSRVWDGIKGIFSGVWDAIVGLLKQAVNVVSTVIGAAMAAISALWSGAWNTIKSLLSAVVGAIIKTVSGWVSSLVGFVTDLFNRWVATVERIKASVVQGFRDLVSSVVSTVSGWVSSVLGFVTNLKDTFVARVRALRDLAVAVFTGLKDAAIGQVTALVDRVRGIKDDVLGFFSGAGSWLIDAGRNIIQGLIDGVRNMIGNLGSAVSDAVSAVTDRLPWSPAKKGPLAKHPPEVGGANIIRQLAAGMGDEIGTVGAMADRVAAATAIRGAGTAAGRAGRLAATSRAEGAMTFYGDIVLPNVTDRSTADDLLAGLRQAVRQGV